ncbi:glycosyltransferase [Cellulomonas carbonis]|uniref:Glycosyl transferase family 2 n=1 Tax=Cellulomonas carbonis T26 TaxID=947969 RepID=A0A0A0BMU4_9CELL|nr:glycosyltransferase [Cellulomonas carbonis]KGM09256.1 glycosyl transferase family 2 [Cellulomonas carbonis T26]GGC11222.1 hypothetical protein GCM10010972_25690 [Cellulomonas carbonis]
MTQTVAVLVRPGADLAALGRTLASLQRQGRGPWRAVVAGGGLTPADRAAVTRAARSVTWTDAAWDGPAHAVLAAGLDATGATWVGVLGQGDEVEPGVLPALVEYLSARPAVDVLYTDDQWAAAGIDGIQTKPDWVPSYLEGWDYLGRLCLVRRPLAEGAFGPETAGAEEWDLHLRATERAAVIEHVPVVGVTRAAPPPADPATVEAGRRAVERRYERLGIDATVEVAHPDGFLRVWRALPDPPPLVSVVVPTGGGVREVRGESTLLVETCLRSLVDRTTYGSWELVLVPSEGTPDSVVEIAREVVGDRLVVAPVTGEFSFSHSVNEGVRAARGELVLLLNDDTEVLEPRWLERMVSVAQDPTVGVVGAKLLFEDRSIQHVGIVHDDSWLPVHAFRGAPDDTGNFGARVVDMDFLVVTGACLLTRRDLYVEVGGFSPELPMAFNDVDFCHKVGATGLRVVCTPFATLHHHESATRVADVRPWERAYLVERTLALAAHDPYVNHRSVR